MEQKVDFRDEVVGFINSKLRGIKELPSAQMIKLFYSMLSADKALNLILSSRTRPTGSRFKKPLMATSRAKNRKIIS